MVEIVIDVMPDGTQMMLLSDEVREIAFGDTVSTTRVSSVDIDENGAWWATVIDGKTLGPRPTRTAVIQDEIAYIQANMSRILALAEELNLTSTNP